MVAVQGWVRGCWPVVAGRRRGTGAARVTVSAQPAVRERAMLSEQVRLEERWCTVVHDDPVNTMTYVTWVFMRHFGMSRAVARRRMLEVHHLGRSVVSRGAWERMEADVAAMHGYGLRATLERDGGGGADGAPAGSGEEYR